MAFAPSDGCPPEIRFVEVNQTKGRWYMIVIGTDTHKRSHALGAVDAGTGRVCGQREVRADDAGHLSAIRWASGLDPERVWAIEDCRHVSRRFERALLAAGERVVRVPPHRMGASRRGERRPGKSDQIDALAIARAVVKDGVEEFPVAYLNERAMEIRLLCDHRADLVAERTRVVNRSRWHLVVLCLELERSLKRGSSTIHASWIGSTGSCEGSRAARGSGSRATRSRGCARSTAGSTS